MPNFYWNNSHVENLDVAKDLTVSGSSDLQSVSATDASLSGTLGVRGKTTLAGLSAAATTITSTLKVSGQSTLGLVSATAMSISNTLGVTGKTTLAGLSAAATALTSTLSVSGKTTLAGLSAALTSFTGDVWFNNDRALHWHGTGANTATLLLDSSDAFHFLTYDGTDSYYVYNLDTSVATPDFNINQKVTGGSIGNAGMNMAIGAYQTISVAANSRYTPSYGRYLVRTNTSTFEYGSGNLQTTIPPDDIHYLPFDGTAYINNSGSSSGFINIYKMAD